MKNLNLRIFYSVLFFCTFCSSFFCKAADISDTTLIKSYLAALTKTHEARSEDNVEQLNKTADFVRSVFVKYSDSVTLQEYAANGKIYKNVICSFGTGNATRIIVGAHYDVCGHQPGADDNASGVVGLLELSRLLKGQKLNYRIDLVAYSLEEPPYFRTKFMGSYIHAKSLSDSRAKVYGMISLEMIGYFKDEKKSQGYPLAALSLKYGNKGNYITLVKGVDAGAFARKFTSEYRALNTVRAEKFTAPYAFFGVAFSDDLNYWKFGYSSLMLTDTAFNRNHNYHEVTDTMETLDIPRMGKVIDGVLGTLLAL
jgi:hypothetical protein